MTPGQCRAARAFLQISQPELAKAANVGVSTVRDFEIGKREPIPATLGAMKAALEARGVRFVDRDDSGALGVLYAEPHKDAAA
jgi:DNA-binding transcriptional regulator YiaG